MRVHRKASLRPWGEARCLERTPERLNPAPTKTEAKAGSSAGDQANMPITSRLRDRKSVV